MTSLKFRLAPTLSRLDPNIISKVEWILLGTTLKWIDSIWDMILSKMTFAHLSQATAASQRFFHRTQNTFNRIQDSFMTIEIHDQGQLK